MDISKLSKALIGLVVAEAERQAEAEHASRPADDPDQAAASEDKPQRGGAGDA